MAPSTFLVFKVRRCKPELVTPAKPTPYEFKQLSDLDDREGLRIQIPTLHFYKYDPSIMQEIRDPVKVIREALAQTLLREGPGQKLVVECTGEGVMFTEANADVTLEQFGDVLHPPFLCLEELLFMFLTLCGGFIFVIRQNHTMSDVAGLVQFMMAMGEMARGACAPSTLPVWQRHLLQAKDPTQVTCTHQEYVDMASTVAVLVPLNEDMATTVAVLVPLNDDMAHRTIFFSPMKVSALRRFVPHYLKQCSTFELLTAYEVPVLCIVNLRDKLNPPLPNGYYGNAFAFFMALTIAGKPCENPLSYTGELLKNAKNNVTDEYLRSMIDLMMIKGFGEVDFGWVEAMPRMCGFYIPSKNGKRENGIAAPFSLPVQAMERFVRQLDILLVEGPTSHL
ncbi:hypothetical protein ACB092_12G102300 [Castanea dentata]